MTETDVFHDRALLTAFRRGDGPALTQVYRLHAPEVFQTLAKGFSVETSEGRMRFRGYREPWALECAVQEVFIRAFSPAGREGYDGLRPYGAYLFGIIRNLVIDGFRRTQSELRLHTALEHDEAGAGDGGDASSPPEAEVLDRELAMRCQAFVGGLGASDRALFVARFQEGQSIQDSARTLGISEHQVKRLERQLRKRFFLFLKSLGYLEGLRYGSGGVERAMLALTLAMGALR